MVGSCVAGNRSQALESVIGGGLHCMLPLRSIKNRMFWGFVHPVGLASPGCTTITGGAPPFSLGLSTPCPLKPPAPGAAPAAPDAPGAAAVPVLSSFEIWLPGAPAAEHASGKARRQHEATDVVARRIEIRNMAAHP